MVFVDIPKSTEIGDCDKSIESYQWTDKTYMITFYFFF